jgi:hypothetical protein
MITIKPLQKYTIAQEKSFGLNGYISSHKYRVTKKESLHETIIRIQLITLKTP